MSIPPSAEVKYTPFQGGVLNFTVLHSYGRKKSYTFQVYDFGTGWYMKIKYHGTNRIR